MTPDDATLPIPQTDGCSLAVPEPSLPAIAEAVRVGVGDLYAALLADAEKPATRRARDQGVRDFAEFLARMGALTAPVPAAACAWLVTRDRGSANAVVDGYRRDMLDRQLAPSTINQRQCTLNRLVWLANKYDLVQWSLVTESLRVEALRDTSGPGRSGWVRFYAQAQREAKESELGVRNLAIVCLLYFCALRREEVIKIDLADWNPDSGRLMVMRKHRHQKTYSANPNAEATAALEAWIAIRGREPGPMFHRLDHAATGRTAQLVGVTRSRLTGDAVWHMVRAIGSRCKPVIKVSPHGFRHAAITEGAARGADLLALQDFGAHSDPKTTMTYMKRRDDKASGVGRLLSES